MPRDATGEPSIARDVGNLPNTERRDGYGNATILYTLGVVASSRKDVMQHVTKQ